MYLYVIAQRFALNFQYVIRLTSWSGRYVYLCRRYLHDLLVMRSDVPAIGVVSVDGGRA